jgi:hypothetical protein
VEQMGPQLVAEIVHAIGIPDVTALVADFGPR